MSGKMSLNVDWFSISSVQSTAEVTSARGTSHFITKVTSARSKSRQITKVTSVQSTSRQITEVTSARSTSHQITKVTSVQSTSHQITNKRLIAHTVRHISSRGLLRWYVHTSLYIWRRLGGGGEGGEKLNEVRASSKLRTQNPRQ